MTNITLTLDINIEDAVVTSVALRDSTHTYGIKRNTDDTVIVASGTATTLTDNLDGTYTATYTTSLLGNSLAYTAAWQVNYTINAVPDIEYVTTVIPAQAGIRSLLNLRRLLSERLGGYGFFTTTQESTLTTNLTSSELVGSDDDASAYDRAWVFPSSGDVSGEQRRVSDNGYDLATGTLTVTRQFSSLPSSGSEIEIHTRLPAVKMNRIPGLHDIINQTLSVLWTIQRVDFPTSTSESFTLTPDWLVKTGQVLDVFKPSSTDYRPYSVGNAYTFHYNAETPFLQGPQNDEEGWEMELVRPGNTWIKVAGVWQESTTGLVNDTDECLFVPQVVIPIAMYFAFDALSRSPWESDAQRAYWAKEAIRQSIIAYSIKQNYTPEVDTSPAARGNSHAPQFGMKGLLGW
jgi:hypothetical protein